MTVERTGAQLAKCGTVLRDRITLMPCKAVSGIESVQPGHQVIAGCLRQDRCCGNRQAFGATLDDSLLRQLKPLQAPASLDAVLDLREQVGRDASRLCTSMQFAFTR
jgi:hypothetical protein